MTLTKNEKKLVESFQKFLNSKTNNVFKKEYSQGGQILSALAGFVPGVGGILSPTIGLIDQAITNNKQEVQQPSIPMVTNTNVYGNQMKDGGNIHIKESKKGTFTAAASKHGKSVQEFARQVLANPDNYSTAMRKKANFARNASKWNHEDGGAVTSNFKQYDTGSHDSGGDLSINENGNASSANSVATVQNKENAYTNKLGSTYIYSDMLTNPETGNTFNIDAAKFNRKFNNADTSMEDRNALEHSMKRLSLINDKVRSVKDMVEKACGGNTKMSTGGIPVPTLSQMGLDNVLNMSVPPAINNGFAADPNLEELQPNLPITPVSQVTSTAPERSVNINSALQDIPDTTGKSKTRGDAPFEADYNTIAMMLKGAGLAKSFVDMTTPAEVESVILPDYRKSDKQMYSTNIDYTQAKQDAIAASNLASNVNRSASGSFAQYQGRQANNYANLADSVGNISMKEALDRNQQYVQRAGYEQGKAVDTANRETQNRINNQQNQANADLAGEKFFSELTDIGTQFNKYQYYKDMVENKKEIANATINEGLALIGSKYTNFGFSDDFITRIKSGTASIDEMVKFISVTDTLKKQ